MTLHIEGDKPIAVVELEKALRAKLEGESIYIGAGLEGSEYVIERVTEFPYGHVVHDKS